MDPKLWAWKKLRFELGKEPALVKDRLAVAKLKELHDAGLASIVFDPSEKLIIACCFLWETRLVGVVELGTLWVHPDYRRNAYNGKPLAERVLAHCTHIARARGLRAIMFTRLDCVAELALRCGWKEDAAGACQAIRTLVRPEAPCPDGGSALRPTRFFCSW